jgi:hypothetical protein
LVDADGESYHRDTLNFQGVGVILQLFMMRLSAVADIPVTRLFGRSPAGENATGESDLRNFYDSLATEQENVLLPVLEHFYTLLAQSMGKEPDFTIEFNSLWTASPKEQAETRKIIAETDEIHHGLGAIAALEIRASRYGDASWEDDIALDDELTKELEQQPTDEPETKPESAETKVDSLEELELTDAAKQLTRSILVGAVSSDMPQRQVEISTWAKQKDEEIAGSNPPAWAEDEGCWDRAVGVADKTDPSDYWAFVAWLYLYHFGC